MRKNVLTNRPGSIAVKLAEVGVSLGTGAVNDIVVSWAIHYAAVIVQTKHLEIKYGLMCPSLEVVASCRELVNPSILPTQQAGATFILTGHSSRIEQIYMEAVVGNG